MSENKVAVIFKYLAYITAVLGGLAAILWGIIAKSFLVFFLMALAFAAGCVSIYAVAEHFNLLQQSADTQSAILRQLQNMAKEAKESTPAPVSMLQDIEANLPQI